MSPGSGPGAAEGYVKYRAIHEPGTAPEHPFLGQLDRLRSRLFGAGLVGALPDGVGYGNLSVRVDGGNAFVISGTATGNLARLFPEHYALVTAVDIPGNLVHSTGLIAASSEAMTHAAAYQASSLVNCVVHVHGREYWERLLASGCLRTPYEAAYGTPQIAEATARAVAALPAGEGVVVMAGHAEGVLAVGRSVAGAARALLAACRAVR